MIGASAKDASLPFTGRRVVIAQDLIIEPSLEGGADKVAPSYDVPAELLREPGLWAPLAERGAPLTALTKGSLNPL